MRKGNGGIIGARRLPSPLAASGVWGVQDAYTADRDAQWSRWPADVGIPFDGRLRMWLEADYGLYQDTDATVPVTADGQPVRAWVNRGNAGKLVSQIATPATKSAAKGIVCSSTGDVFSQLSCDRRIHNYVFSIAYGTDSSSGRNSVIRTHETISGTDGRYPKYSPSLFVGRGGTSCGYGNSSKDYSAQSMAKNLVSQITNVAIAAGNKHVLTLNGSILNSDALPVAQITPGQAQITVFNSSGSLYQNQGNRVWN